MHNLLRILRFTGNLWPYYVAVSVFTILMSLSGIAVPYIIKMGTDIVVDSLAHGSANISGAVMVALLLLVVDLANTLITNIGGYLGDIMSEKMRKQLSERYYAHLLNLPQRYYDNELTGTIINRLDRTITELTRFINAMTNNFGQMLLSVVLVIGIVATYSWEMALLLAVLYPLFMWLTALTSKRWQALMAKRNREIDIASGRFAEVIAAIRVVKSYIQERRELQFFKKRFAKNIDITKEQSHYWHKMDVSRRVVLNIIFFGVFAFIFVRTAEGKFTIGEMVLLIQLVAMARMPIFGMSFMIEQAQRAIAGSKDYFEIMGLTPEIRDAVRAKDIVVSQAAIEYKNVSFGYVENETVLHDVNFSINSGEKVAFVGESGEGKTTITSLLLRLYEPQSGEIVVGTTNIQNVTQASLRRSIAVVFQEPALFSGTIRENISYARPDATEKEIIRAAKAANAYGFIEKLEHGIDTEIGERGLKLSGGQKQRIAIARAILKDAPILILDEATSSLDSRAEKEVQTALTRLMKGRTTLIIAHRLSTIAHVDKIITIKGGRIDEVGTPQELKTSGGIYSQLIALQMETSESAKKRLKKYEIAS